MFGTRESLGGTDNCLKIKIFPSKKRLKFYAIAIAATVAIKIPWVWHCRESGESLLNGETLLELSARRRFLVNSLTQGGIAPSDMPFFLPDQFKGEWAIGTFSMTVAALTNIAFLDPDTREESLRTVERVIDQALTHENRFFDAARWSEDPLESLDGDSGHIGYLGHLHWMIGAYGFLGGDQRYREVYDKITVSFVRRYNRSPGLCLETYPGEIYIPDNVVVFASLANYARLYPESSSDVSDLVQRWIVHARTKLIHSEYRVLPFHLDADCRPLGGPKGSGVGWDTFYLPFVDAQFAREQYDALKRTFLQTRIITGIREYPRGKFGLGDVDSGPVIAGFSPSGTGFAVAGAVHAKDAALLTELLFTGELVGSTIETSKGRRYLLAPLVGEAIMLAMKTARTWDTRYVAR